MEKKRLYIVGAGGFGREVAAWARDCCQAAEDLELVGFLDDNPHALSGKPADLRVVGSIDQHQFGPNDRAFVAMCEPRIKKKVVEKLRGRVEFAKLIHPSAVIGAYCTIGVGSILCPNAVLTANVTIGDHVHLNLKVTVGHDAQIGSFCTLNSHTDITGSAMLGEGVFCGSHTVVLPNARVGAFARVGAGTVVLRNVPPDTTVMGVPARRL